MELGITIISGVGVFFLSQLVLEFFFKPIKEYRDLRRRISVLITRNENYYTTILPTEKCSGDVQEKRKQIAEDTRIMASELRGFIETLPKVYVGIPKRDDI